MRRTETSLTNILGEEFGPYKLVSRLGVGGMAETFVAIRKGPGSFTQRVCLKLVLPFYRENEDFVRLFEREARLAATLRHRNIVGVIDFGEIEGMSYMALELVDGVDLRTLLDSPECTRLPAEIVALVGLELAEALEHAHSPPTTQATADGSERQGIVHRDISPSNVLISERGEVLLTDFGVAKAITGTTRKQSAVKGKVPYMAPEHLRAESLDGRADLFSLGVVLFEALAGERPYEGPHDPATIMLILKGDHPPLTQLAPDAPPGLCRVIERLLEPDSEDRPQNAAELIEELDEFAPSPRVRRQLARLVCRLRTESEADTQVSPSQPPPQKTEVLPDTPQEQTGVRRTGSPSSVEPAVASTEAQDVPLEPTVDESHSEGWAEGPSVASGGGTEELPSPTTPSSPTELASAEPIHLVRPPKKDSPVRPPEPGLADLRESRTPWRTERAHSSEVPDLPMRQSIRRPLVLAIASLLTVGAIVGGTVALWPSGDDGTDTEAEASTATPTARPKEKEPTAAAPPDREAETDEGVERRSESPSSEPPSSEGRDTHPEVPAEPPRAGDQTEKAEGQAPRGTPVPAERSTTKQPAEMARKAEPAKKRHKPAARPLAPATLTITVFPWGHIWINGKPWGRAPLKNESLPPGTYKISAGQGEPSEVKTVKLKAGRRATVSFDLTQ
jgi:serine/threonine protein kinase